MNSPKTAALSLAAILCTIHFAWGDDTPPNDPFAPLLQDIDKNVAPEITPAQTVRIKEDGNKIFKTITGGMEVTEGVRVRFVTFKSVPVYKDGQYHDDTVVYAMIAEPADASTAGKKLPGILLLHGGGGSAQIRGIYARVINWAKAGYVAVGCDLPGIAGDLADVSTGTWRTVTYKELTDHRFTATPDIKASWIYTAEATALKAFALLKTQPEVDPSKLGIVGESWGGYSTTMLCGLLGDRVEAGFSVFGCGFYDEDSDFQKYLLPNSPVSRFKNDPSGENLWLTYLDAGRRAPNLKAHFYLAAASDDHFFRPPAVMKTLAAITNAKSLGFQFAPNDDHKAATPGGSYDRDKTLLPRRSFYKMEEPFFDYYLKGTGYPLPEIKLTEAPRPDPTNNLEIKFDVTADPSLHLLVPELYYSTTDKPWTNRLWLKLDPGVKEASMTGPVHHYTVTLPATLAAQKVDWYLLVSDETGDRATTISTLIYQAGY